MHSSTSHTARHTESRTKRARRPYDDAPDQRPTDTSNRSRASSTPAEATSTYVLGLSSLSRANDLSLGRDAIPPSSLADQEGPWPLMAPISNLLASTGAEAHYTTASSAFHSDLLGPDDFPGTVSLFNPSTPSPAPPPLMEPYAHYRPEASHHYANNLSLGSSHAGSAFELDLSPMVKAEEDSTDWYPDHSDSGSSLSANLSETYDAQSHFQRSPHHAWHANAPINQAQDFQRLEHHSGKLPIKSSVRPATGPQKSCQCNICGRLFGKRSNLKTHEQYKHCLNYVKRFECPNAECGRKFDRKMDLKRHIKSVSYFLLLSTCC